MAAPVEPPVLQFPTGFLWGASAAAHQVEGNNVNSDWWRWEQTPGRIRNDESSGLACDHFTRYRDDFELLAELGHNAHRLSIEWSRVEPRPNTFDHDAIEHYRDVLVALRDRGMEPFVTLHHFTNPVWLADGGGWLQTETVEAFARFAARMAVEYRELVRYWITLNEPTVYAYHGHMLGARPPGGRSPVAMLRVLRNFVAANRRAYQAIKAAAPEARVGVAHQRTILDPHRPRHPADRALAGLRLWLLDEVYTAAFARHEDFAGVNYYTRGITRFQPTAPRLLFGQEVEAPADARRNALGWEIYPRGLYRVLVRAARRGLPIVITENGVADREDDLRPSFLVQHLEEVHRALRHGARVEGYLHWTSMDNFEWSEGFEPRFGLIAVDRATLARRPKPSAYLFADVIRANGLRESQLSRYAPPAAL